MRQRNDVTSRDPAHLYPWVDFVSAFFFFFFFFLHFFFFFFFGGGGGGGLGKLVDIFNGK